MGAINDGVRAQVIADSPLQAKYSETVDNESAYELLSAKYTALEEAAAAEAEAKESKRTTKKKQSMLGKAIKTGASSAAAYVTTTLVKNATGSSNKKLDAKTILQRGATNMTSSLTRSIVRGIMGNIK